jgi:hypothetical protein
VEKLTAMLSVLANVKRRAWWFILTGDKFWFFCYPVHSKIWLPLDADASEMPKQLIHTPKLMIIYLLESV